MKKNLRFIAMMMVLMSVCSISAFADKLNDIFNSPLTINYMKIVYGGAEWKVGGDTIVYYQISNEDYQGNAANMGAFYNYLDANNGVLILPDSLVNMGLKGYVNVLASGFNSFVSSTDYQLRSIKFPSHLANIKEKAMQNAKFLDSVYLPAQLMYIENSAFQGCSSLKSVNIPSKVKELGINIFKGCSKLRDVKIEEGVKALPDGMFYGCDIDTIVIPSTVTSIGNNIFTSDKSLRNITLKCTTPPTMTGKADLGVSYKRVAVFVPEEAYEAYKNDENWNKYNLHKIGDKYVYDATVTGRVEINVNEMGTLKNRVNELPREITDLKVTGNLNGDDIRMLRVMMKLPTYDDGLTSDIYPDSILRVLDLSDAHIVTGGSYYASLYAGVGQPRKELFTTDNVLGKCMFEHDGSLKSILLPASLTKIDSCALSYCNNLKEIAIPKSVTYLGDGALSYCNMVKVSMGNPTLGDKVFYSCRALKTIVADSKTPAVCETANTDTYTNMFSMSPRSKCTLYVPVGSAQDYQASELWKDFTIAEDANLTSVKSIIVSAPEHVKNSIYDLQGRKLDTVGRGINIVNGKKVWRK